MNTAGGAGGSSNAFGTATIKTAWDQFFRMALRHRPLFRESLVDVRPADVTSPGQTVTLFKHKDIAPGVDDPSNAANILGDFVDPTPVTFNTPDTVNVTVNEYGRELIHSKLLRETSLANVMQYQAEQVAYNMENELDRYVRFVAKGGTNVRYSSDGAGLPDNATNALEYTDKITSDDIRSVVADLETAAVAPKRDEFYVCYIHPHVAMDLRRETGSLGWRDPHTYSAPNLIWKGEVGVYERCIFVQTGRAYAAQDGAATGGASGGVAYVYRTLIVGREALVEATAVEPGLVYTEKVGQDFFNRQYALGWYGILGWARFREEALRRIESGSSKDGAGIAAGGN